MKQNQDFVRYVHRDKESILLFLVVIFILAKIVMVINKIAIFVKNKLIILKMHIIFEKFEERTVS